MTLKSSYQRELNAFCKTLLDQDYSIRGVTAGALSQARAKLNPWAFQRLTEVNVNTFYQEAEYKKWKDYRLLAIDGSVINLPYSKDIAQEFGYEEYQQTTKKKCMARCSLLYDVENQITIDGQIGGYRTSELVLMYAHLEHIKPGDLILADRGYALSSVFHKILGKGADFCIRVRTDKWNIVKEFMASSEEDKLVEFEMDNKTKKKMRLPLNTPPIRLRLIKVKLEDGTIEVLATSLFDTVDYSIALFKELYHKRWGVEEVYKMLKNRINLEMFSGKTARSIYQDFYSKVLMMSLCSTISYPIEQKVREEYKASVTGNKHDQCINKADAMAQTRNSFIPLFLKKKYCKTLKVFDTIIYSSRQIIRPGRKFKRKIQSNKPKPHNYKQL